MQRVLMGVVAGLVLGLGGCASFVADQTGTAAVGTPSGERSLPQMLTDSSIARTAQINLYKLDPRFRFSRIKVDSFHSAVLLTGQVPDTYLKELAEQNVRSMSDVRMVHNYLSVGDKVNYSTIMQDNLTTADVRRRILLSGLRESKVKISTEDGIVYVMGRLLPSEVQQVGQLVQQSKNVRKIVSLVDVLGEAPVAAAPSSTATVMPLAPEVQTPVAVEPAQGSNPGADSSGSSQP